MKIDPSQCQPGQIVWVATDRPVRGKVVDVLGGRAFSEAIARMAEIPLASSDPDIDPYRDVRVWGEDGRLRPMTEEEKEADRIASAAKRWVEVELGDTGLTGLFSEVYTTEAEAQDDLAEQDWRAPDRAVVVPSDRQRPTLYLSNWSSHRTPGQHGPGRKFSAMARPRAWERGDGMVTMLAPSTTSLDSFMQGRMSEEAYFEAYRIRIRSIFRGGLARPGKLVAKAPQMQHVEVGDGDTLCCACARPDSDKRAHVCHLEHLAGYLVRAGWRVVVFGREIHAELRSFDPHTVEIVYTDTGEPYPYQPPEAP